MEPHDDDQYIGRLFKLFKIDGILDCDNHVVHALLRTWQIYIQVKFYDILFDRMILINNQ